MIMRALIGGLASLSTCALIMHVQFSAALWSVSKARLHQKLVTCTL